MLKDFSKEAFDILIQAGQSNSEGYGFGNVCSDAHSAFVETDGLDSNLEDGYPHPFGWVDDVHFCRRAIYQLGERYFAAYQSVLGVE